MPRIRKQGFIGIVKDIQSDDLSALLKKLKNRQSPINRYHKHIVASLTLLAYAITLGNSLIIKCLLESGANPNGPISKTYDKEKLPLFVAIKRGNVRAIRLLLTHGADPNHRYESALKYAIEQNASFKIINLIIQSKGKA